MKHIVFEIGGMQIERNKELYYEIQSYERRKGQDHEEGGCLGSEHQRVSEKVRFGQVNRRRKRFR